MRRDESQDCLKPSNVSGPALWPAVRRGGGGGQKR